MDPICVETLANRSSHFCESRYTIVGQSYMGRCQRLGLIQPPDVEFVDCNHPGGLSLETRLDIAVCKESWKEVPFQCHASRRRGPHHLGHSGEESDPLV